MLMVFYEFQASSPTAQILRTLQLATALYAKFTHFTQSLLTLRKVDLLYGKFTLRNVYLLYAKFTTGHLGETGLGFSVLPSP